MQRNKVLFNNKPLPKFLDLVSIDYSILDIFEDTKTITLKLKYNKRGLIKPLQENELIEWLKGDNFKHSKLVLYNNPNVYYKAKLSSKIDTDGFKRADMTIEFECEKYKYDTREIESIVNNAVVKYCGDIETYPNISFKVLGACSELHLKVYNKSVNKTSYIRLYGAFNANDLITINQTTNKVTVNGLVRLGIWGIDSKRHKLYNGDNVYKLEIGNAEVKVKYTQIYY